LYKKFREYFEKRTGFGWFAQKVCLPLQEDDGQFLEILSPSGPASSGHSAPRHGRHQSHSGSATLRDPEGQASLSFQIVRV
jgi:hypothetical protein